MKTIKMNLTMENIVEENLYDLKSKKKFKIAEKIFHKI